MITVLTGGSGGAKFLQGLTRVVPPDLITAIVNTGDDLTWWGLHVSPDLDSITYALAGMLSRERGWGIEGDTFTCLERMRKLGAPAWFQVGDRDLATHLRRTQLLTVHTLTEATAEIASELGLRTRILPMSDNRVETRILSNDQALTFQEYFVRERYRVPVTDVRFEGAKRARPARGVIDAILDAEAVLIAPSNPVTSIGPILSIRGVRAALCETAACVVAVSPIVGSAAVSGPAGELMKTQDLPVSIGGVALAYKDFLDVLIADKSDHWSAAGVEAYGINVKFTDTIMNSGEAKEKLARATMAAVMPARAAGRTR